jgi:DNA-binding IclR family transcriptional regulator
MAGNSSDCGRSVTSKVISILLIFTRGNHYSLTEIARQARLPLSTAHRLTTELAAWGILERTEEGLYRPSAQLKAIGSQAPVLPLTIHEKARQVMEDLAEATTSTNIRLGRLRRNEVVFAEKLPGGRPMAMFYESAVVPAHASAMGKALLAFSSPQVVDAVIACGLYRYTSTTLTTPEQLRHALAVTRLTRVAVCRGEFEPRASAVAVPVFGPGGDVAAALELEARNRQDLRRMQPPLVVAARALSRDLIAAPGRAELLPTRERQLSTVSRY